MAPRILLFPPPQTFDLKFTLQLPAFHVDADHRTRNAMIALQSLYMGLAESWKIYTIGEDGHL